MISMMVTTLALICTLLPLWIAGRVGQLRWVSPLHLLGYFTGLGFLAKSIAFAVAPDLAFYRRFDLPAEALVWGAIYLTAFILLTCLGYLAVAKRSVATTSAAERAKTLRLAAADGWLVAAALIVTLSITVVVFRARGFALVGLAELAALSEDKQIAVNGAGVGATLAGLKTLFIVPKLAFVIVLARALSHRALPHWLAATLLFGCLVAAAVVSGDRFELLELLIIAAVTFSLLQSRSHHHRSGWVFFASAGVIVLGLAAVMTGWRGNVGGLLMQVLGATYFLDLNVAVMVTGALTHEQLLWGETYLWWSFGWVPRALWFDKPATDVGVYLKSVVMQLSAAGAFNVTGPGEAYINFGWLGALVGALLGAAFRLLETASLRRATTGRFVYYPLLVSPFVQASLQSSFSAFVVSAAVQAVVIWLLLRLWLRRGISVAPANCARQSGVAV